MYAAKQFGILMAVGGIAPVLSPLAGGGVIGFAGWRGVFWALAVLNLLMVIGSIIIVKESLPQEHRSKGGVKELLASTGRVLGNRRYLGFTFAFAFAMAAMFGYISASPFVYQNILGLNPTAFSLLFALNALGITITSIVGVKLVGILSPLSMTYIGVSGLVVFSAGLLAVVTAGNTPLFPTLALTFLAISSLGLIFGNAAALATDQVRKYAGTGSAVMGALQFMLAAIASPLVGLAGEGSAGPMAIVMLVAGIIALVSLLAFTRGAALPAAAEQAEQRLEPASR
jgi:DHA1 family bicyclomycin/chloramphenicol resistance-like MFS transporter